MNNKRRKEIEKVIAEIERIRDDEEDYLDNMPENLQCSSRADVAENAIGNLEEAIEYLEDILISLDEAIKCLEDAKA